MDALMREARFGGYRPRRGTSRMGCPDRCIAFLGRLGRLCGGSADSGKGAFHSSTKTLAWAACASEVPSPKTRKTL